MGFAACAGPAGGAEGSGRFSVARGRGGSPTRGVRRSGRAVGPAAAVPAVPGLLGPLALSPGPRFRSASSLGAGSNPRVEWRRSGVCLLLKLPFVWFHVRAFTACDLFEELITNLGGR